MRVVYPDARVAALGVLEDELANYDDAFVDGVKVGRKLPPDWTLAAATPFVQGHIDAAFAELFVVERQTVRITVWHRSEADAYALAQLCRGILLDHSGPVLRHARRLNGPIPATDATNNAPIAFFTVEATVRSLPV